MNWNSLTDASQLDNIKGESFNQPVLILKHSKTCSISSTALNRLERNWKQEKVGDLKPYFLDLLANRPLSAQIASTFDIQHESPQVLLIKNGICTYSATHFDISFAELERFTGNGEGETVQHGKG